MTELGTDYSWNGEIVAADPENVDHSNKQTGHFDRDVDGKPLQQKGYTLTDKEQQAFKKASDKYQRELQQAKLNRYSRLEGRLEEFLTEFEEKYKHYTKLGAEDKFKPGQKIYALILNYDKFELVGNYCDDISEDKKRCVISSKYGDINVSLIGGEYLMGKDATHVWVRKGFFGKSASKFEDPTFEGDNPEEKKGSRQTMGKSSWSRGGKKSRKSRKKNNRRKTKKYKNHKNHKNHKKSRRKIV
jgi:hypothetical protein